MNLIIDAGPWGDARPIDIAALLGDVMNHFLRHFSSPPIGNIRVQCRPDRSVPLILYRADQTEDYVILLTVQNRLWAKFSYQFAHELCHLLSNYERLRLTPNQWFHESLCETASLFALTQMAAAWSSAAPYQNWRKYAPELAGYVAAFLARPEHQLPTAISLGNWLRTNGPTLRENPIHRELNGVVASRLLPLFSANPHYWESVSYLPNTDETFETFLGKWRAACPGASKQFINDVATLFEINLLP